MNSCRSANAPHPTDDAGGDSRSECFAISSQLERTLGGRGKMLGHFLVVAEGGEGTCSASWNF